jgi:hypothetical protein
MSRRYYASTPRACGYLPERYFRTRLLPLHMRADFRSLRPIDWGTPSPSFRESPVIMRVSATAIAQRREESLFQITCGQNLDNRALSSAARGVDHTASASTMFCPFCLSRKVRCHRGAGGSGAVRIYFSRRVGWSKRQIIHAVLRIGTILCWAVAIGSEYAAQKWPKRKKLLNVFAMCVFALALCGDYVSYRYDNLRESRMQATIDAQGFPEAQWFQATDGKVQTFTISHTPFSGSVEVLINGLTEPAISTRSMEELSTVSTQLSRTDQVTIKHLHRG